jgi:hypothetical protein
MLLSQVPHAAPRWLLSASGLSGGKNHYIEIWQHPAAAPPSACGWFYVDGLDQVTDATIESSLALAYGTLDTTAVRSACLEARLVDDAQREILRVEVEVLS